MSSVFLVLASFLASAVEMVEALTIVLAVGVTRGWRSPLIGTLVAAVVLGATVAAVGPALVWVPIGTLRLVVGALLLIFGLQWLRKGILRAGGHRALHDENAVYRRELQEARSADRIVRAGVDWYAFTIAFKGVFLEGLEVAFIVLTFGGAQGSVALAGLGAGSAVVLVGVAGLLVHRPLSRVPENTIKLMVGVLLTTFGIFWGAEGAGAVWPGDDLALLGILGLVVLVSLGLVVYMRHQRLHAAGSPVLVGGEGQ